MELSLSLTVSIIFPLPRRVFCYTTVQVIPPTLLALIHGGALHISRQSSPHPLLYLTRYIQNIFPKQTDIVPAYYTTLTMLQAMTSW